MLLLAGVKLRSAGGLAASMWAANRLKLVAGFLTMAVIAPAIYLLFRFLFSRIVAISDQEFGAALSCRLLSSAFMAFSVFLAVSSMISGISTLYRSRETSMLLSLPLGDAPVAVSRIAESWFHAGWSTILLGVPVVLAFASVTGAQGRTAFWGIVLLVPVVLVSVAVGSILVGAFSRLGGMGGLRRGAAGVVVAAAVCIILYFQSRPEAVVIPDSSAADLGAVQRFVAGLPEAGHSPWPHSLYGSILARVATGTAPGPAGRAGLILLAEALAASAASLLLLAPGFRARHSRISGEGARSSSSRHLLRHAGYVRAVVEKDILLFARDPVQWSQLALLGGLFLMYAFNIHRFDLSQRMWLGIAVFMNVSFSGFVMATLLVRFSFPSISLEGPGLAFTMQLPGAGRRLIRAKRLASLAAILPLVTVASLLSTLRLGAGGLFLVETMGAVLLMAYALTGINTALGAVFPSFSDNSPASIASGQGGIIAAFASMGYVLLVVSVLSYATRAYLAGGFHERAMAAPVTTAALLLVPTTVAVSALAMGGAVRSFGRRDF